MKQTDFKKENRAGLKFEVDFIKHLEKHWEDLPDEKKKVYQQLHSYQNELIDAKCEMLTRQIITKRNRERKYDGAPRIKGPTETTNDETKKITFDPLFWYALEVHALNSLKLTYDWRKDENILKKNAADKWSSLSQDKQKQFINRAKEERLLYYKDKTMVDSTNTKAIFKILEKKLAKYKKK